MASTYYKATQPNGTDFHTGTVDYARALATGEVLRHPEKRVRNRPSTYFSVSTVPTDCTGFRWPCRLFEVEAVGRPLRSDHYPNKRALSALRVVRELPAHEVFGPQGEEVAAVIERAGRLTTGKRRQLTAARSAAWDAAWLAARDAVWDAARGAAWAAARGVAWAAAGLAVRLAARDAALALLTRDLIGKHGYTQEHFDLLYGPWRKVVENGGTESE